MIFQADYLFSDAAVRIETAGGRVSSIRTAPRTTGRTREEHAARKPRRDKPTSDGTPILFMSPGFFDLQVNGWRGIDYSGSSLNNEGISAMVLALAGAGTTRHLPTIITNTQQRICRNLEIIRQARRNTPVLEKAIPGVHIEGPYISSREGPRGAHDPAFIRAPSATEYREWQDASGGTIRIVTLAPEQPGALRFIEELVSDGVIPAIGHTAAGPETIRKAVQAGARLSTHLGNGSHAMLPRLSNFLWEQLACDDLYASLISDGFHLPASVLQVMERAKGYSRLILISDASPIGGLEPGVYSWGDMQVEVNENGRLSLAGTPYLAGAGHLLDWDIPRFMRAVGCSLREAVELASRNPRRFLGLTGWDGEDRDSEPGAEACSRDDFILFEYGPCLRVTAAFLDGENLLPE